MFKEDNTEEVEQTAAAAEEKFKLQKEIEKLKTGLLEAKLERD